MIDAIFAIKFVHLLAAAVMFGTWLCLAIFLVLAHRSGNTSVVALTAQFVVGIEMTVMAAAFALQPISGFPLASAIGLSPLGEFWIVVSLVVYAVILACWLAARAHRDAHPRLDARSGAQRRAAVGGVSAAIPHVVPARRSDPDRDG